MTERLAAASPRFTARMSPALGLSLRPWNMATAVGELVLTVWLLVKGVNTARWKEQALERQP